MKSKSVQIIYFMLVLVAHFITLLKAKLFLSKSASVCLTHDCISRNVPIDFTFF